MCRYLLGYGTKSLMLQINQGFLVDSSFGLPSLISGLIYYRIEAGGIYCKELERTATNIVKDIGRDAALALTFANANDDLVAVSIPILEKTFDFIESFSNSFVTLKKW